MEILFTFVFSAKISSDDAFCCSVLCFMTPVIRRTALLRNKITNIQEQTQLTARSAQENPSVGVVMLELLGKTFEGWNESHRATKPIINAVQ